MMLCKQLLTHFIIFRHEDWNVFTLQNVTDQTVLHAAWLLSRACQPCYGCPQRFPCSCLSSLHLRQHSSILHHCIHNSSGQIRLTWQCMCNYIAFPRQMHYSKVKLWQEIQGTSFLARQVRLHLQIPQAYMITSNNEMRAKQVVSPSFQSTYNSNKLSVSCIVILFSGLSLCK